MGVSFGSFDLICQTAALAICPLVGTDQGIEPTCYSRNVDIGGTLIFQPGKSLYHDPAVGVCGGTRALCTTFPYSGKTGLNFEQSSHMFHSHRRHYHDRHYDLPYTKQVHCSRCVVWSVVFLQMYSNLAMDY